MAGAGSAAPAFHPTLPASSLTAPPVPDPATNDREVVLRSGDFVSRLPAGIARHRKKSGWPRLGAISGTKATRALKTRL